MKRMLFNATHSEELRVAIVDGQKLIDIDIETAGREQRKSNIYKGIVTRVEPSLEACFVNYGEDRHGFLPFKEISRQYFKESGEAGKFRIQDVIKEGLELFVQVEKEERGNKGAALTTFISLAGRYLVLMPNNPRGGGVSRRIEGEERQELRDALEKLNHPKGMSIIARTAGIGRSVEELQWDLNYLLQLWNAIDGAGQSATGAFLIYQESSLVIRAIRDYFSPDIGEVLIDTDEIYEQAKQFMRHVMPDMMNLVKRYRDDTPLFSRFQIEHQIETAYSRMVPLPSGGAIVIDHTEALVSIDVNSARSTRGTDIEDTALRTNLEAAEEVARQLRLRDLGGLIVIDFIDMEKSSNQKEVEQRVKDSLHFDRARVQMGKISRFGLMELSRQRIRPALNEGSHTTCPRCNGTGVIRDTESTALHVLRILQEEAMKEGTASVQTQVPVDVATFLLNEKRSEIYKLEVRLKVNILLIPNKHLETPHYEIMRLRHDDERLEDPRQSFELASPKTEQSYYEKKVEGEATPRQEAVIKGVLPTQPAPKHQARIKSQETLASLTPSSPSLIRSIIDWFKRKSSAERTPSASEQQANDRSGRDEQGRQQGDRNYPRNGRGRNRRRGGGREDRTTIGSTTDEERNATDTKNSFPNQRSRHVRNTLAEEKTAGTETPEIKPAPLVEVSVHAATDSLEHREHTNARRQRNRGGRGDRGLLNTESDAALSTPAATQFEDKLNETDKPDDELPNNRASTLATSRGDSESSANAGDEPRRRRRRGRGNGRTTDSRENISDNEHSDQQTEAVHLNMGGIENNPAQLTANEVSIILPAEPTQMGSIDIEQNNLHGNVAANTPNTLLSEPTVSQKTSVLDKPLFIAENKTLEPAMLVSNPSLDKEALTQMLSNAGMLWIETNHEKMTLLQSALAAESKPTRIPRERKPITQITTEHLVLVETKSVLQP